MLETEKRERLRELPAVDAVLRTPDAGVLISLYGLKSATSAVRQTLGMRRQEILAGEEPEVSEKTVLSAAASLLSGRGLRHVVNATGVVLHTNLGRSVLSKRAIRAAASAASSYSNLEYDLAAGKRGSRYDHAVPLLKELTGAEDALVVNNCAGATLLALSAVVAAGTADANAGAPEVVVSRGQLIEIGGGFRIPEVLALSGARMREVGTTNRTRLSDYEKAINENTRAVLWVHPSNFEIQGFTESVGVAELSTLGPPVVADVGSGALLPISDEPKVQAMVREGAALTIFSGDKLLGGPQAGIAVGESRWISAMRRHPLTRALRADKLCLAALEATLTAYLEGVAPEELPTLKMLYASSEEMKQKAERLAAKISRVAPNLAVDTAPSVARSGGGTLPTFEIPSLAVRLGSEDANALAESLRSGNPPVVGRVGEGRLWLDVRTLLDGDEDAILRALEAVYG
ncbi:MAG TPA: L-seryl-tRNA(Sec) selenium transferase [Rubrobacteraceae bacterium]|nr:L-seryl-tRNA(Sec) selenium transferase [Rubrobacteraceae bacterium]